MAFTNAVAAATGDCSSTTTTTTATKTSNIVPIRVDVLSEDKTIRIVDTLLFDPTCWPVAWTSNSTASATLTATVVEENVIQLAHTILSDAEVQGMGRTVRHFTGRLDLWSPKLQKAIEDQLRPQLWKIAMGTVVPPTTKATTNTTSNLLPISIRLMIDRLVVHEDILWDATHHGLVSPFEFASEMAQELNLPEEATVAIATTIIEQIYGLEIDATPDRTLAIRGNNTNTSGSNTGNASTTIVTSGNNSSRGAWVMDPKDHASIASQIVAQHRSI